MRTTNMGRAGAWTLGAFILCLSARIAVAQDTKQFVQQAVNTELAADRDDHSHWLYFETDRRPDRTINQWVAETHDGDLKRIVDFNGQPVALPDQRSKMDAFIQDPSARAKQHKSGQHDDKQAAEMLQMLPQAFIWTETEVKGSNKILHFKPDPQFSPPDLEGRVFAAMEGDMAVDTQQHRIVSLKGKMIHDVKFLGGLLGGLDAGGTFDVERRESGHGVWQITETHVHIQGHALIFKLISEQEDDVRTDFKPLSADISLQEAKSELLAEHR